MEIGKRIKKYRELIHLSQEELADKVYVSRQTISNWENDKSYPDINSLKILTNIFNVSLDEFIKGDIEKVKGKINHYDVKKLNNISFIFSIELLALLISAYPLIKIFKFFGIILWSIIAFISLDTSLKIEKIYKNNDCRTYKEIVAFTEGKTLSQIEQIEERAKRPYQKLLLGIAMGIIAVIVFMLLEFIFG